MSVVKLYTKNNCPACKMTKRWLQSHDINYTELNVEEDIEAMNYLVSVNKRTLPQIESEVGDWQGFRPDKLRGLVK